MQVFSVNKKKVVISLAIAAVAIIGDKNSEDQSNRVVAAFCDNATHGIIGALTWMGVFIAKATSPNLLVFFEIALCGMASSFIDLDHFFAAKSLHLKDAVNLKSRPPLHCTTLVVLIVIILLCISYFFKIDWLCKFGWILAAAGLSHHIRDSKRRGLWIWPLGSTNPTPVALYIIAQMLLPHILSVIIFELVPSEINIKTHEPPQIV